MPIFTYSVSGTRLSIGNTIVNKSRARRCPGEAYNLVRETDKEGFSEEAASRWRCEEKGTYKGRGQRIE